MTKHERDVARRERDKLNAERGAANDPHHRGSAYRGGDDLPVIHKARVVKQPATGPPTLSRMIRLSELPAYVGLQRSQIDELIKDKQFPAPVRLSDSGRAKAWVESELIAWQQKRLRARDAGTSK